MSLAFRLGMQNGKVDANPARLVPARRENNVRIRYLDQFAADEEARLRGKYGEARGVPLNDAALMVRGGGEGGRAQRFHRALFAPHVRRPTGYHGGGPADGAGTDGAQGHSQALDSEE